MDNKFTSRPATFDDIPTIVAMINEWSLASIGQRDLDEEDLRNDWKGAHFDPSIHTRLSFASDGLLISYCEVHIGAEPRVHQQIWGCVRPGYEGNGIATANIAWAENYLRSILADVPAHLRVTARVHTNGRLGDTIRLFENNSYKHLRDYYRMRIEMDSPPAEAQLPAGITIRTCKHPDDDADLYNTYEETFQEHFGHVTLSFEDGLADFRNGLINDSKHDPDLWRIAMDGDQIAGICLSRIEFYGDPDAGWINLLCVRKPWRKRGLGAALLRLAFAEFYKRGKRIVDLGVDAGSLTNAVHLYESVGMHIHDKNVLYEKELRPGEEIGVQ